MPPLRVRYDRSTIEVVDLAWSDDPDESDPPSIAILFADPKWQGAKTTWNVEDPTDPGNDPYPPYEASSLRAVELVRCAASHWQRVHPRMRRFTETELNNAYFFVGLNALQEGLKTLVEARKGACAFVWEPYPWS